MSNKQVVYEPKLKAGGSVRAIKNPDGSAEISLHVDNLNGALEAIVQLLAVVIEDVHQLRIELGELRNEQRQNAGGVE